MILIVHCGKLQLDNTIRSEKMIDLPDDLVRLVISYVDRFPIDVSEQIDQLLGKQVLEKFAGQRFEPSYPQEFLTSFIRSFPTTGTTGTTDIKLRVDPAADVTEEFLLQYASERSILLHPNVSEAKLEQILQRIYAIARTTKSGRPDDDAKVDTARQNLQSFNRRTDLDPQFILKNRSILRDKVVGSMLSKNTRLTDELVKANSPLFKDCLDNISSHPNLTVPFLVRNKHKLRINSVDENPNCKEILLADPELMTKFVQPVVDEDTFLYSRSPANLGPWYFELHPQELTTDRIARYLYCSDLPRDLIPLFRVHRHRAADWYSIIANTQADEETVSEAIREHDTTGKKRECTDDAANEQQYFCNPALSVDFFFAHDKFIPIDWNALSNHPHLPVEFIVANSDKLNIRRVFRHNKELPGWLMRRAMLVQLGVATR